MSNFHGVTQYGSKIRHTTVTGVTCDTAHCQLWHQHAIHFSYLKNPLAQQDMIISNIQFKCASAAMRCMNLLKVIINLLTEYFVIRSSL